MRLVTSWRIAVRSASFWSSSIFWFWTSWAGGDGFLVVRLDLAFEPPRLMRQPLRLVLGAPVLVGDGLLQGADGVDVGEALDAGDDVERVEIAGLVHGGRAPGEDVALPVELVSARLRSMRERTRRSVHGVELRLRLDQLLPHALQFGLQVRHLGRGCAGLLLQVEERGGGRRSRQRPRRLRRAPPEGGRAKPRRPLPCGAALLLHGWCLKGMDSSPTMSLPCVLTVRGIGPAGRFLTAGQAGARRRPGPRPSRRSRESLSEGSGGGRPTPPLPALQTLSVPASTAICRRTRPMGKDGGRARSPLDRRHSSKGCAAAGLRVSTLARCLPARSAARAPSPCGREGAADAEAGGAP